MSVTIKIKVENIPNFNKLYEELKNPTALLKDLQTFRRNAFYAKIASGQDATGKPVAKLSEPYAKIKKKRWGKRSIRVASGKMQASYDSEVIGNKLIESIDSPIAIYHQEGTSKMPQRKLLPESWEELNQKEKTAIMKLLKESLDDVIADFVKQ